jgi:lysophospholipase L1-like esterase
MKVVRIVFVNLLVLVAMLGTAEVVSRLAFPEFEGHVHSDSRTLGRKVWRAPLGEFPLRVPSPGHLPDLSKRVGIVLGDSISQGYGTDYEDIWWVQAARQYNVGSDRPITLFALAAYAASAADSLARLEDALSAGPIDLDLVLYQFNLNDVNPYDRASIQRASAEGVAGTTWFNTLARWRYEHLNRSVFLRVVQHYGGQLARNTSGSCESRGLDALGPYTWTYGSRALKDEAEREWKAFEQRVEAMARASRSAGARFAILVSPLMFDIDPGGAHPHYNHLNLDFSCATIDPRQRLQALAARLDTPLIDPAAHMRAGFEARLAEGNFTPFFFTADENHFTPTAARYVAEILAAAMRERL